jgi:hypothetical protein
MKRIVLMVMIGWLASIGAWAYSGGNGTEQNPYLISSKADMEQLAGNVNSGESYAGVYFRLTGDLAEITTIIGDYRYFSGVFDGGGYALEVNISTTSGYAGVFGCANSATIKNLGVTGSVKVTNSAGYTHAGGICGYLMHGSITDCFNTGSVNVSSAYSSSSVGGICGYAYSASISISNCYNTGSINVSSASSVGGICGIADSSISNCYNTGAISAAAATSSSAHYSRVGGICGASSASISNCYNTGAISSDSSIIEGSSSLGGICGEFNGSISNCYNMGDVFFSDHYAGGICGRAYNATISDCYSTGAISASSETGGICGYTMDTTMSDCYNEGNISSAYSSAGGICGWAYDTAISNCYNTGASSSASSAGGICGGAYGTNGTIIINCYNRGDVSSSLAGGICGRAHNNTTMSDCHNEGNISSAAPSSDYYSSAGGICGVAYGTTINNCHNEGDISSSNSSSDSSYAGGICGEVERITISNCYNTGAISSSSDSYSSSEFYPSAGGICGESSGSTTISNCYNTGVISSSSDSYSSSGGICGNVYRYNSSTNNIINCYNMEDVSASSYAGGICGYRGNIENCFVSDCRITLEWGGGVGRISYNANTYNNCYADKNITLNGSTVSSSDANSRDGKDATLVNFQTQSWLQSNLGWDFQTVWEMSNVNDPAHKGLPILKGMDNVVGIPVVRPDTSVSVDVYPNPAKDELFFIADTPIRRVEIGQLSGARVVVKEDVGQGIHISHLPNGTYLVRIYTEAGAVTKKIIKN